MSAEYQGMKHTTPKGLVCDEINEIFKKHGVEPIPNGAKEEFYLPKLLDMMKFLDRKATDGPTTDDQGPKAPGS